MTFRFQTAFRLQAVCVNRSNGLDTRSLEKACSNGFVTCQLETSIRSNNFVTHSIETLNRSNDLVTRLLKTSVYLTYWIKKDQLTQLFNKPVILWVAVMVLCGSQCMCYSFNTVHNGTSKVIRRINPIKTKNQECEKLQLSNKIPQYALLLLKKEPPHLIFLVSFFLINSR